MKPTMEFASINPATGEVLRTFEPLSHAVVEAKMHLAAKTFPKFRRLTFDQRAEMMNNAAEILQHQTDELARLITLEVGKPVTSSVGEIDKCVRGCHYYAKMQLVF